MRPAFAGVLLALLLCSLLLPIQASAEAGEWKSTVTPTIAINNGDNVTIGVNGWPTSFVIIYISNENETVDTLSLVTGTDGKGELEWSVPYTCESGTYYVTIVSGGANVTRASFEVIYDRVTYTEFLLRQQQKQLDLQKGQNIIMGNYITEVHDQIGWIAGAAIVCGVFLFIVTWHDISHYRGYKKWKLEQEDFKRMSLKGLMSTWHLFRDPPVDGDQSLFNPGLADKMHDIREVIDGKAMTSFVAISDPTAQGKYRIYPLDVVPNQEVKETVAAPVPEAAEEAEGTDEEAEEAEEEPAPARFERFSGLAGRLHFIRNWKVNRMAKMAGDEEEAEKGTVTLDAVPKMVRTEPETPSAPVRRDRNSGAVRVKRSRRVVK